MKLEEKINKRIKEIEEDSRYQSGLEEPATIDINAPLAMIQLSLETELKTLKAVRAGLRKTAKQVASGYHRPVCPKCNRELHPETNGVGVLDLGGDGKPYELYDADLWKCPGCGIEVVGGFGQGPISVHYLADFEAQIKYYQKKNLLIKNTG
ncbi:hypothetical protein LCGC14_2728070 [marine sediment metagenome]|uniref:Uncharacterized protein n=1 Tax=marine sediment metagenome TaxID=412755 RepID=A0A0F8Z8B0_9ZZZZ